MMRRGCGCDDDKMGEKEMKDEVAMMYGSEGLTYEGSGRRCRQARV